MQALVLVEDTEAKTQQRAPYHPVRLATVPIPVVKEDQVLVKLIAAAFNHRDVWIRLGAYPGIQFNSILGADGVGVVASDTQDTRLTRGSRVVIYPAVGWEKDPRGPEGPFSILGLLPNPGTFAEYISVPSCDVFPAPAHLSDAEAAALPLASLTAYRAVFTKAQVKSGDRVLITGIGGGVALAALRFCVALGAECYVTSSSLEKIQRAIKIGAKAGANYRADDYIEQLKRITSGPIDAVIDGAGGDFRPLFRLLRPGARIVCYGGTGSSVMQFDMLGVLKQIELCGSTMGSRREFVEMLSFVEQHKLHVDVDCVLSGLSQAEQGFEKMREGKQFGKIVIQI